MKNEEKTTINVTPPEIATYLKLSTDVELMPDGHEITKFSSLRDVPIETVKQQYHDLVRLQNHMVRRFGYDGLILDARIKMATGELKNINVDVIGLVTQRGFAAYMELALMRPARELKGKE